MNSSFKFCLVAETERFQDTIQHTLRVGGETVLSPPLAEHLSRRRTGRLASDNLTCRTVLAPLLSLRTNETLKPLGEMSMQIVRFICLLALLAGASLLRAEGANAQASPDVQQACTPDAMRLCSQFIPDVAKITACMKAKHSQLSAACMTAMRGGGRHEVRHEARHVVRHERREYREARHYRGHCDPFTHMCN
jgi:hypothetical protein